MTTSSPASRRRSRRPVDCGVGVVRDRRSGSPPARARRSARDCRHGRRYGRSAGPEPSHTTRSKPRSSRRRCSISSRARLLRLGLSRHCSVVSTVPDCRHGRSRRLRGSSRTSRMAGRPTRRGAAPMSSSPCELIFAAPAVEARSPRRGAPPAAERRSARCRAARCRRTARRLRSANGRKLARQPARGVVMRGDQPHLLAACRRHGPPRRTPRLRARRA